MRVATATVLAATAVLAAGCGAVAHLTAHSGNPVTGKTLFVSGCGQCHALADAKTAGVIGPSLDDAFGPDKRQGFDESTIRDVVRGQIAYPETEIATGGTGMPANIYRGQKARDVAIYVATCAGVTTDEEKQACRDALSG